MALVDSFEREGNWLFRWRGQLPVVLFVMAIPAIYLTDTYFFVPRIRTVLLVASVAMCIFGQAIRAIAVGTTPRGTSGRNREAQEAETLNTKGIYSIVRHPLYVGNYLMWAGIALFTLSIPYFIIMSLLFWLYYERIMFAEERYLEKKFGDDFREWANRVPAFLPSTGDHRPSGISFSLKTVLRREYSGILAAVIGFLFVSVLRRHATIDMWFITNGELWILGATLIFTFGLRIIKKTTNWLNESDRS